MPDETDGVFPAYVEGTDLMQHLEKYILATLQRKFVHMAI
jgi:hypothetical protein